MATHNHAPDLILDFSSISSQRPQLQRVPSDFEDSGNLSFALGVLETPKTVATSAPEVEGDVIPSDNYNIPFDLSPSCATPSYEANTGPFTSYNFYSSKRDTVPFLSPINATSSHQNVSYSPISAISSPSSTSNGFPFDSSASSAFSTPVSATSNHFDNLATSSSTSPKLKRPMNSFMMYRQDRHREVSDRNQQQSVSKIIADQWRNESVAVKEFYNVRSKAARELFKQFFPHHRFACRSRLHNSKASLNLSRPLRKKEDTAATFHHDDEIIQRNLASIQIDDLPMNRNELLAPIRPPPPFPPSENTVIWSSNVFESESSGE